MTELVSDLERENVIRASSGAAAEHLDSDRGDGRATAGLGSVVPEDYILQIKRVLYDSRGGHSDPQHVLLGGYVPCNSYAVYIAKVTVGVNELQQKRNTENTCMHLSTDVLHNEAIISHTSVSLNTVNRLSMMQLLLPFYITDK